MKKYLVSLKNSRTGKEFSMVLTGSFDSVHGTVKSVIRVFGPAVRQYVYIKSISEL